MTGKHLILWHISITVINTEMCLVKRMKFFQPGCKSVLFQSHLADGDVRPCLE